MGGYRKRMENAGALSNKSPRTWKGALALGIVIGLVGGYFLAWLTFLIVISGGG
jgi:hypothetical protein